MAWVSQVSVNTNTTSDAGWCLWLAQEAVGAPHIYPTARACWDNSPDKHWDTDYPRDAVVALYWSWTSKVDGLDYGHVVLNVPGRGLFSSPKNWGVHGNDWYGSIEEVSRWLGATYLGWTPEIAGVQLAAWNSDTSATPASTPAVGSLGQGIAAEGNDWTYWVPSSADQATVQAGLTLAGTYSGPLDGNLASDASVRAIKLVTGNHGFFDLNYFDGQMNKNLCHAILLMASTYGGYSGRMDWQIDGHVWAAFDAAIRATAPAPAPAVVPAPVVSVPVVETPKTEPETIAEVVDSVTPVVVPEVIVEPVKPNQEVTPVAIPEIVVPAKAQGPVLAPLQDTSKQFKKIQTQEASYVPKGGLFGAVQDLAFWNDLLSRGLNTFLQVSLAAVGTGAVGATNLDYIGILNLAVGGTIVSILTTFVRATTPKS